MHCLFVFFHAVVIMYIVVAKNWDGYRLFCMKNVSRITQGTVVTHLRCGEVFNDDFLSLTVDEFLLTALTCEVMELRMTLIISMSLSV